VVSPIKGSASGVEDVQIEYDMLAAPHSIQSDNFVVSIPLVFEY
jgi:hypothetical protein